MKKIKCISCLGGFAKKCPYCFGKGFIFRPESGDSIEEIQKILKSE